MADTKESTDVAGVHGLVAVNPDGSSIGAVVGGATSANQTTIIGHVDGIEGLLTTIDTDTSTIAGDTTSIDGKTPALGQALAASSVPVVMTAAQVSTLTPQTDALTDTQLRATAVPVSGTFYQATQPVSFTGSTDVATQTTLAAINTKLTTGTVIGDVNLGATDNAVLDAIATATEATQAAVEGTLTVTGGGGGTEYTEDVATANPIVGTATMIERDDQLATVTPVEGDNIGLRGSSKGALWVTIPDASGDPITSFGGGTEYTEDVATANPQVGKAIMMERDDALTTVTPVEGDWIGTRGTAEGALWTQDFNSDAILADTTTIAGAVAGGQMQVDIVADGAGLATSANQLADGHNVTIDNGAAGAAVNIQDGGNTITVDGTVTTNSASSVIDANNTTTSTLTGDATYTGTATDCTGYSNITNTIYADVDSAASGMKFEFCADSSFGANIDTHSFTMDVSDSPVRRFQFPVTARYFRIKYINGSGAQSAFNVQNILHRTNVLTSIHRIGNTLTTDRSAQLVRAVIAGETTAGGGAMVNVKVNPSGTLETNALTDTELRATPVPISGSVTADLGANNDVTVTSGAITETNSGAIKTAVELIDNAISGAGFNITQQGGVAVSLNTGVRDAGTQRVTIATNDAVPVTFTGSTDVATQTTLAAINTKLVSGTVIGDVNLGATDNAVLDQIELNTDPLLVVGGGTEATAQRVTIANDSTGVVTVDGTVTANPASGTIDTVTTLTGGGIAHDSADSGNPHKMGFKAYSPDGTTPGTAVAEGDRSDAKGDLDGRMYVSTMHPRFGHKHLDGSSAYTDEALVADPGDGFQIIITKITVSTGAATAMNFFLEEGASKIFGPVYLEAVAGRGYSADMFLPVTASTAVTITTSAAIAQSVDIDYFIQAI